MKYQVPEGMLAGDFLQMLIDDDERT